MPEASEKSEPDSPLKEPLKKKGNDIHNPYPNFKVSSNPHFHVENADVFEIIVGLQREISNYDFVSRWSSHLT